MPDRPWSDDEEDWSETDDDLDDDLDADDDIPCPECGASIYADLDHCPECGYWLVDDDLKALDRNRSPSRGVRVVALVMLVVFVLVLLAGGLGM